MGFQSTLAATEQVLSAAGLRLGAGKLTPLQRFVNKYFYFAMSVLIAALVVSGFRITVNANLLNPSIPRPLILWFHAAAFTAWIAFFIFQSALVRTHNVKWHRFFGWFGAVLGTAMVPLGIATSIVMGHFDTYAEHLPGAEPFLIVPFFDMTAFAIFFGLAVLWRKNPELHRRLLFIATCGLLDAAFGRFDYLYNHGLFFWCLDGVILLGVFRDLYVNRRIHKTYAYALPPLVLVQAFVTYTWLSASPWWVHIAHAILG
jgi:hypothetical protein